MRFIPALWMNRLNNKTGKELLEKSLSCNTICHSLVKFLVHGMFGVFQSPGGPRDLVKMVQVKHEVQFCKVTSTPAPVPLCLASGTGVLKWEGEDDFAAAVL